MLARTRLLALASLVSFGLLAAAPVVRADPLPGEVLKFQQLPINNLNNFGVTYQGHDEVSTAYAQTNTAGQLAGWQGTFMADDFADKFSTPVVHISWWGSYIGGSAPAAGGVQQFLISFESDVPAIPGAAFSHPGVPLLSQIVTAGALTPGSGTFTEQLVNGNVPEHLYKYNAELALPFGEQPDTVYWLKIVALTANPNLVWGWHDRDYTVLDPFASTAPAVVPGEGNIGPAVTPIFHFQDDAVTGRLIVTPPVNGAPLTVFQDPSSYQPQKYIDFVDGPQGIGQYSKDLAFELYTTVPEPGSLSVVGMIVAAAGARRRRA